MDAYLDIETTGLSTSYNSLTVVGMYVDDGLGGQMIQPIGDEISARYVLDTLHGVDTLYTYNGRRFDLPFINRRLGINLEKLFEHRDLMFDCWSRRLYGGLKAVERRLGIPRKLPEVNGLEAVKLWRRYHRERDVDALFTLLEYNKEDVLNLKVLKAKLGV
jgi:uncharacterized protein YprB with RNaseH-like and TPR domain